MKKLLIYIAFLCLILSGCENINKEIKWFNSQNEAIQYGMKEEGISKENIISNFDLDGELFIIYKKEEGNQLLVSLSNIAIKDNKYAWYRNSPYVNVQKDINIEQKTENFSGKELVFYTGIAEKGWIFYKNKIR